MGITLMLVPLDQPGHHHRRHLDDGRRAHQLRVPRHVFVPRRLRGGARWNHGFRYISQALDLERFTMFTFSPIKQRLDLLTEWVLEAERDSEGAARRSEGASPAWPTCTPRPKWPGCWASSSWPSPSRWRRRCARAARGSSPRRCSHRSTSCTPPNCRSGSPTRPWTSPGPGSQLRVHTEDAPMEGRSESTYPLHGYRHHRRRSVGDPEEHHRPPGPRTPQELLRTGAA